MRWILLAALIGGCDMADLGADNGGDKDKVQRCIDSSSLGGGVFDADAFDRCMRGNVLATDAGTRD